MQRWKQLPSFLLFPRSSNLNLPFFSPFASASTFFSSSSSSFSPRDHRSLNFNTHPYPPMETLFSGGLQSPSVDRRGHILVPNTASTDTSFRSSSTTLPSSSSSSTPHPVITRTSPDYWSILLANPLTQIILLHDLRPILFIDESTPNSSAVPEPSSSSSLVRLSVDQLYAIFPGLFHPSTRNGKEFLTTNKFIPICLGIMENSPPSSTTGTIPATERISSSSSSTTYPLIAIDIGVMVPDRDEVQNKIKDYFTLSPSSSSTRITPPPRNTTTVAIPDAREFLVGSLMKNKVHPKRNHSSPKHTIPSYSSSSLYPSSSSSPDTSLNKTVQYSDLPVSQMDWSIPYNEICLYGTARSLYIWHNRTKYCGSCGGLTVPIEGGIKRICSNHPSLTTVRENTKDVTHTDRSVPIVCRETLYPRTDPVVITLVQNYQGTHVLLARSKGFPPSMYSCLAGFVEPGETLEEAAAREVFEETGVIIDHVTYLGSQPWPLGRGVFGQLMVGFIATARKPSVNDSTGDGMKDDEEDSTIPRNKRKSSSTVVQLPELHIDPEEIEDAQWYTTEQILASFTKWYPPVPSSSSSVPITATTPPPSESSNTKTHTTVPEGQPFRTSTSTNSRIYLPGPFAIAHQLIKEWLMGTRPRL